MSRFDLAVIGSGPAGHYGALQAAELGKRVVVVEAMNRLGGVSTLTGTIPSKSLREATLHLTGLRHRTFYGPSYRVKRDLTIQDLTRSAHEIVSQQTQFFEDQLQRAGVEIVHGHARFVGTHRLSVRAGDDAETIEADHILLAVGSRPAHPPGLDFDDERVLDSKQVLDMKRTPKRLIVVGAGVIGVEYASIFATLDVPVTLINKNPDFLTWVDAEILENLKYFMRTRNVDFLLGETVEDLVLDGDRVIVHTDSNKQFVGDHVLYAVGRHGNADLLNAPAAGLEPDARGRLTVNEHFRTSVPHIYAAGDVIGFPALAATSREQGRRAVCDALGALCGVSPAKLPYGIYAIPEISMVGPTEAELTRDGIPYCVGRAHYREIGRGQILGDRSGLLKILFHRESLKVLAVHIVGEGATELIHIGQMAEACGLTLTYFVETVMNYPTLAESYKVAAADGLREVGA